MSIADVSEYQDIDSMRDTKKRSFGSGNTGNVKPDLPKPPKRGGWGNRKKKTIINSAKNSFIKHHK